VSNYIPKNCKYCGRFVEKQSNAKVTGIENINQSVRTLLESYYGQDRENFCSNSCSLGYLKTEAVKRIKGKPLKKDIDFLNITNPEKLS
jgi:hypothetical protein